MNWKEKFDDFFFNEDYDGSAQEIIDFISSEIIGKIIEDIPEYWRNIDEQGVSDTKLLKQQLRDKWLGKEQE